jgi:hypothetical protein
VGDLDGAARLEIRFGAEDGNQIVFGLDEADPYFVMGSISVRVDGEWIKLADRNGIERLALRHLADDVRDLVANGGSMCFGDHDYGQLVQIESRKEGVVGWVDLPSEDRWDIPLGTLAESSLLAIADAVEQAERVFGPLIGHCGCGTPTRTWRG